MGLINWFKLLNSNTLYYPGCLTKGVLQKEFENYKQIFSILGIDYILLSNDEVCCGLPVLNAGYKKDARDLAKKNFQLFKDRNISKIITNCPSCYHIFKTIYPKLVLDWDIEVEHATVAILKALKRKKIQYNASIELVTYHDPCHLGRYEGIYEEPRKVIEMLGAEIIEMKNTKENSLCCGGGGGLKANYEDVANKIAKRKIQDISDKAAKIITPCGLCYSNLNKADTRTIEFSTFVLKKLKEMKK